MIAIIILMALTCSTRMLQEKDQYLGGWIGAAFFLVGAPAAILMGYFSHAYNRCNMFFWVVILGALLAAPSEMSGCHCRRLSTRRCHVSHVLLGG